ncbi:MAG: transposase-like protein [Alphaproteobacteria bacterium]|jgi:transposase-like protein
MQSLFASWQDKTTDYLKLLEASDNPKDMIFKISEDLLTHLKKQPRRRHYSEDFKREAVATYEASGKSRTKICRLLDISCGSLLQNWSVLYGSQKRLKQALGNHAVKDYLSELREESWREISSESALKEVDKRVSKKALSSDKKRWFLLSNGYVTAN